MSTSIVTQQLRLTDSADVFRASRWVDKTGVVCPLSSGRLVVRATEDDPVALIDIAAVIDVDGWANAVIPKASIVAADFEAMENPAVWEFVLTRTADGRTISAVGGTVIWSKGVAW